MKLAPRETVLALATAAVALFAVSSLVARPKLAQLRQTAADRGRLLAEVENQKRRIADKAKYETEFSGLKKLMPAFPAEKKMDVHWLSVMDSIASKNGVNIIKRQVGEEKKMGDVYELPIECQECEGSLDSIVHFLFDMQNEGAMLDVRQLLLKPQTKGVMRGRFMLNCAYMRESK